ncbi:MAG: phosphoribosylamine--glycine ligase [Candidatus Poribacteria bacterium]|nr:phosphoribosylamine--glycine ligase [Candidatus Poribacteria bacterium]
MKILVVGRGGREHTIVWKIAQSPLVEKIYWVPGNLGTSEIAECRSISLEDNFAELADFAEAEKIDLTIVGPEDPLANGLIDILRERGLRAFGPDRKAAILEASKDFAKRLMVKNGIPTAVHRTFDEPDSAIAYLKEIDRPVFVKADGLAAGKGAIPGRTLDEAIQAVQHIMVDRAFGGAGDKVVIEELLVGEEASFTVLTDGTHCLPFVSSQDHKPALDGDRGKNTGGMGAYSPAPVITPELHEQVMDTIVYPAVRGMQAEGRPFQGVLYVGLMITETGPKVVEFNCRFGDPETQVLLPRMASDLVPLLEACIDGTLDEVVCDWKPEPAVCVVMASGGYPDSYETGKPITGLERANALESVVVFHAATKVQNGDILTDGGRILGVTALAGDIRSAIEQAYRGVAEIHFDKAHFRRDIGHRALDREL